MYTVYHFNSAAEVNSNIIKAIKAAFQGKPITITIEEEVDETAFLLSNPENRSMLNHSIAQDKNNESVTVTIPDA